MEISNKLKLGGCYSGHFVGGLNRSNPDKFATEIKKHLSTERWSKYCEANFCRDKQKQT